ncbi:hypothetical protein ACFVFH_28460 [Streptomyces sp. NPDC057697]|uniref:hypothetical protein n=1 Tax=Streptomyces sp. NPDC057697 TaxID=3346219 RepID=UPI003678553D
MTLAAFGPRLPGGGCRTADAARGAAAPPGRARRRNGLVLTGAGLALLPWLGYLAGSLPPAESAAWVALDALEALALLTAGHRLLRADDRHRAPAAAAAVLLLADTCVDLATAAPGAELAVAVAMAVAAELPLAALCAAIALRGHPCAAGPDGSHTKAPADSQ